MRREPLVYAVLLVAGLAVAFRTWRHEEKEQPGEDTTVELWHGDPQAIVAVEYTEPGHRLALQPQGSATARYIWATEDTVGFRMDEGTARNFLNAVAAPRSERDLGVADARARRTFGLDTSRTQLVVHFRDGTRELVFGDFTPMRSGSRYVLEKGSGHVFTLAALTLPPLGNAAVLLVEHRLHTFTPDSVGGVTLSRSGRSLALRKVQPADRQSAAAFGPAAWAPVGGPAAPDSAFTVFMRNVESAAAVSYAAREDARTMSPVLRVDFVDGRARAIGFLELFQRPGAQGKTEFFARSELTNSLVRLYPGVADSLAAEAARRL